MAFTVHKRRPDVGVRYAQGFDNVLERVGFAYEMLELRIPPWRWQEVVKFSVETETDAAANHCL
jgi:hypothetical protein